MSTAQVLTALADPTRRRLVELLADHGARSATALAGELPITRQAVVQHLAILKDAGVVGSSKAGREVRFALRPQALTDTAEWMRQVAGQWDQRLLVIKAIAEGATG
ncbi:ArsR/SmtB family transcription factor [Kribbella sp. CA-293567]|uniref:ArsR/SmtB family transcription factor n=1 Tax=Kribbella sp. CA-293567 TaxID=3002436 RepID=UPI0022DD256B|nr:metalloregulator ArsR/SmtB family transcription factor [Kribbella sp. CA-293567]WBQ03292.1 metalloregulator ArsR/SmtB family transcription factor [Kribbella sp. CA-293567]